MKTKEKKIYGVAQAFHGHYYKWIFTEDEILRQLQDGGVDLDRLERDENGDIKSWQDLLWPIGGSNSSATDFEVLDEDGDIKAFLTSTVGCDYEDPMLVDIAEFLCDACRDDDGQITDTYMKKLGLTYEECHFDDDEEGHMDSAEKMIAALQQLGYDGFDYDNPFYGENRDMRYSELCELYETVTGCSSDTL